MPKYKFNLNKDKWDERFQEETGIGGSDYSLKVSVIIEAEDAEEAFNVLGMFNDKRIFDNNPEVLD